jgi:hypothetical protein
MIVTRSQGDISTTAGVSSYGEKRIRKPIATSVNMDSPPKSVPNPSNTHVPGTIEMNTIPLIPNNCSGSCSCSAENVILRSTLARFRSECKCQLNENILQVDVKDPNHDHMHTKTN